MNEPEFEPRANLPAADVCRKCEWICIECGRCQCTGCGICPGCFQSLCECICDELEFPMETYNPI
jgi:hypothetical protein